ncbi:MAG: RNA recognition motif domain-containing protein [Thiohalomonadales bacterium]
MKTLRPRVKIYLITLLFLLVLFSVISIPLYLKDLLTLQQLMVLLITAITGHLIASLPFPPELLSMPVMKNKPVIITNSDATCTLYVGNLLYRTKRDDLERVFSKFGEVISARIILDKDSRKSKGYGFVEMSSQDASSAITALNGSELNGRALRVNEAKGR